MDRILIFEVFLYFSFFEGFRVYIGKNCSTLITSNCFFSYTSVLVLYGGSSSLPLFSHLNISFLIQPLEYTIDAISDFMPVTELFLFPPQLGMHAPHGVLKSCFLWQAIQHS